MLSIQAAEGKKHWKRRKSEKSLLFQSHGREKSTGKAEKAENHCFSKAAEEKKALEKAKK